MSYTATEMTDRSQCASLIIAVVCEAIRNDSREMSRLYAECHGVQWVRLELVKDIEMFEEQKKSLIKERDVLLSVHANYQNCIKEHMESSALYNYMQIVVAAFNKPITHISDILRRLSMK